MIKNTGTGIKTNFYNTLGLVRWMQDLSHWSWQKPNLTQPLPPRLLSQPVKSYCEKTQSIGWKYEMAAIGLGGYQSDKQSRQKSGRLPAELRELTTRIASVSGTVTQLLAWHHLRQRLIQHYLRHSSSLCTTCMAWSSEWNSETSNTKQQNGLKSFSQGQPFL